MIDCSNLFTSATHSCSFLTQLLGKEVEMETEEVCARHEAEPQEEQLPPAVWELLTVPPSQGSFSSASVLRKQDKILQSRR